MGGGGGYENIKLQHINRRKLFIAGGILSFGWDNVVSADVYNLGGRGWRSNDCLGNLDS